jgi:hypothetical protein
MIYEMRVYDKDDNLKATVSAELCNKIYWSEFHCMTEQVHTPESLSALGGIVIHKPIVRRTREMECTHCHKKFMGNSRSRFCTYTAVTPPEENCKLMHYKAKALAKRKNYPPKPCGLCSKSFTPKSSIAKFCLLPCTTALYRQHMTPKTKKMKCRMCGGKFTRVTSSGYARYCQNPCTSRLNAKANYKSQSTMKKKACQTCKTFYKPRSNRQRFCRKECVVALERKYPRFDITRNRC